MEERTAIRLLHSKGIGIRKIAPLLGLSRNTVRKYLREDCPPQYRCAQPRVSQWEALSQGYRSHVFSEAFLSHHEIRENNHHHPHQSAL